MKIEPADEGEEKDCGEEGEEEGGGEGEMRKDCLN